MRASARLSDSGKTLDYPPQGKNYESATGEKYPTDENDSFIENSLVENSLTENSH